MWHYSDHLQILAEAPRTWLLDIMFLNQISGNLNEPDPLPEIDVVDNGGIDARQMNAVQLDFCRPLRTNRGFEIPHNAAAKVFHAPINKMKPIFVFGAEEIFLL